MSAFSETPSRILTGTSCVTDTVPLRATVVTPCVYVFPRRSASPRGAVPLSGGRAGRVEDRERVAADRELPVSQPLRLRRLALRYREDRLVDAAPHGLEGLGPFEDHPGVEIDVVLHARGGV